MTAITESARNDLIESHRSYAQAIARTMLRSFPWTIDREEIVAAAEFGLVQAAATYKPGVGSQFKTYSYYRIKGAVYDYLREQRLLSQADAATRFDEAATALLPEYTEDAGDATPSTNDLRAQIEGIGANLLTAYRVSAETVLEAVPDTVSPDPETNAIANDQSVKLRAALAELPEKNRQVMEAYYFQNLTMEEISKQLGMGKPWVSKLHARSIEMMKKALLKTGGFN